MESQEVNSYMRTTRCKSVTTDARKIIVAVTILAATAEPTAKTQQNINTLSPLGVPPGLPPGVVTAQGSQQYPQLSNSPLGGGGRFVLNNGQVVPSPYLTNSPPGSWALPQNSLAGSPPVPTAPGVAESAALPANFASAPLTAAPAVATHDPSAPVVANAPIASAVAPEIVAQILAQFRDALLSAARLAAQTPLVPASTVAAAAPVVSESTRVLTAPLVGKSASVTIEVEAAPAVATKTVAGPVSVGGEPVVVTSRTSSSVVAAPEVNPAYNSVVSPYGLSPYASSSYLSSSGYA